MISYQNGMPVQFNSHYGAGTPPMSTEEEEDPRICEVSPNLCTISAGALHVYRTIELM